MSTQLRELKNIDNENIFQIKKIQTVQVPEMEARQNNIQKALDDLDRDNQEILRQFQDISNDTICKIGYTLGLHQE